MGGIPIRNDTMKYTSTDTSVADPICVAGRWYKGTINAEPGQALSRTQRQRGLSDYLRGCAGSAR
jgi:hypothetical protein